MRIPFAFVRRREPDTTNYQVPVTDLSGDPVDSEGRVTGIPDPTRQGDFDRFEPIGGAHRVAAMSIVFAGGPPAWAEDSWSEVRGADKIYLTDEPWTIPVPGRNTVPPDRRVLGRPPARGQSR